MNLKEEKYNKYALVREMMETPSIIAGFSQYVTAPFVDRARAKRGIFLTGEGSSRIFPAKRAMAANMKKGAPLTILTEGSTQAEDYRLDDFAVFAASNSGQTKEVIRLVSKLKKENHNAVFGLTANHSTRLADLVPETTVLKCGKEAAVAATKSVVEQGLFYDSLLRNLAGEKMDSLAAVADMAAKALAMTIDSSVTDLISKASMIYFAGRNTGVAEELSLKTNEITRKKSAFLEGTFAVHGIEEVMDKNEVLIWVEPFDSEQEKYNECLVKGVGLNIIAISTKPTMFPTVLIPDAGDYAEYVQLAAGWNLLVETGISLGINLDKPVRARKVGNEYTEA